MARVISAAPIKGYNRVRAELQKCRNILMAKRPVHLRLPAPALLWIVRIGYGGRGAVFLLLGVFAGLYALGLGRRPVDATGVFVSLTRFPAGVLALFILSIGLLCFAAYRVGDAVFDIHRYGQDAKGILRRLGLGISGLLYVGFVLIAASIIFGWRIQRSSDQSVRDWTAWLMKFPAGEWLVSIVGLIVIATGIGLAIAGIRESFRSRVRFQGNERLVVTLLGKIGFLARSLIMLLVGSFLILAAVTANPQHAEGFAGALRTLEQQPFGSVLLGMTAIGMICFGAFGISEAFLAEIKST